MGAEIDDDCQGTNTREIHPTPLREFFDVCHQNHTQLNLQNLDFMQETMQYLRFDNGNEW